MEIGLKLLGSELSPFLWSGVILATFQMDGKVLVEILRLQICCITGKILGPACLSNLEVIPSVPQEEDGDRSLITDAIVVRSNSSKSKMGGCAKSGTYCVPSDSISFWRLIPILLKKSLRSLLILQDSNFQND